MSFCEHNLLKSECVHAEAHLVFQFVSIFKLKLLQLQREPACQPNKAVDIFDHGYHRELGEYCLFKTITYKKILLNQIVEAGLMYLSFVFFTFGFTQKAQGSCALATWHTPVALSDLPNTQTRKRLQPNHPKEGVARSHHGFNHLLHISTEILLQLISRDLYTQS